MVDTPSPDDRPATAGEADSAIAEVTELLRELSFAVARQHHWLADQLDLHDTDVAALMIVHDLTDAAGVGPSIGEVGNQLGLTSPATTALVDRLVAAGHLARTRDPGDRRRIRLRATRASYGAVGPLLGDHIQRLDAALAAFDDEELAVARRVMTTVLAELTAALDEAQGQGP